jgi:4-diphosphocytidyl-2-C-methyl-D-erythritol kinase
VEAGMTLQILSPAKVNLFLYVLGRRPDGYHELFSLMCRIGLYDEILLRPAPAEITLQCTDPALPANDDNLALRAARRFFEELGRRGGVAIHLTKRIPVAAGLGGGSSNAASVLLGLNHLHGAPLSSGRLSAIGKSLGADVPFFLFQSPALASGIGDRLEAFTGIPPLAAVVVNPPFAVSTRMVYQNLNLRLTNRKKRPTRTHLKKTAFTPVLHLYNDLEAVTLAWHPELVAIKNLLAGQGALGSLMSGSGPSVFGLFPDPEAARKAADALPGDRGWRVFCGGLLTGPVPLIREI